MEVQPKNPTAKGPGIGSPETCGSTPSLEAAVPRP